MHDLEFLASKSKDLIDKQIASYRQQHTTASSIIAIVALFIPLFLSGLDDAHDYIKYLSLLPVVLFVISICILLFHVFRTHPLSQTLKFDKFQELINANSYEDLLLYEIGNNKTSFEANKKILRRRNMFYNISVLFTILAIIISASLLLANMFFRPKKEDKPIEVKVVNKVDMLSDGKTDTVIVINNVVLPASPVKPTVKKKNCCPGKATTFNIENQTIQNQTINNK